jgi:hypothetical protein
LRSDVLTNLGDVLSRGDFTFRQHLLSIEFRLLNRQYGISARWQRRSGHDPQCFSREK